MLSAHEIVVIRCAVADLEGILPEFDCDGERTHPGWTTRRELKELLEDYGGWESETERGTS